MNKLYTAPVMNVEVFETEDVIALSVITATTAANNSPKVTVVDLDEDFNG